MMPKNIMYRIFYPTYFTSRDYERFGCTFFSTRGYEVQINELSPLIYDNLESKIQGTDTTTRLNDVNLIKTEKQLQNIIESISKNDIVLNLVPLNKKTFSFYRLLTQFNVNYTVLSLTPHPITKLRLNPFNGCLFHRDIRILLRNIRNTFVFFYKQIFLEFKLRYWFLKAPSYWLTAGKGRISRSIYFPKFWQSKEIKIHSLDFEIIQSIHKDTLQFSDQSKKENHYAVFLDEFYPFHPDFILNNIKQFVTPSIYFSHIRDFFTDLEKKLSFQIKIAAHPRSDYENRNEKYFGERDVLKNKTHELIKNSCLVIAHSSTSLSYAVYFHKPILIVTTDEIEKNKAAKLFTQTMAQEIGTKLLICKKNNLHRGEIIKINLKKYKKYITNYITWDENSKESIWEIYLNQVKLLHEK